MKAINLFILVIYLGISIIACENSNNNEAIEAIQFDCLFLSSFDRGYLCEDEINEISFNGVTDISSDGENNILFISNGTIFKFESATENINKFYEFICEPNRNEGVLGSQFLLAKTGTIYTSLDVSKILELESEPESEAIDATVFFVFFDSNSEYGIDERHCFFPNETVPNRLLTFNPEIYDIIEAPSGEILYASEIGLFVKDEDSWTLYTKELGGAKDAIYSLCPNRAGEVWAGTDCGLDVYDDHSLTRLQIDPEIDNISIYEIFIRDDDIWLYTASGLKSLLETGGGVFEVKSHEDIGVVNEIVSTPDGRLWFGTDRGLSVYDGSSWTHLTVLEGQPLGEVKCLLLDSNGVLWLGTDSGLVSYFLDANPGGI